MDIERAAHCTYRIRYHMVMCVKYRNKMLLERSRIEFLKEIMEGLALRYYLKFEVIGIDEDHFHVVMGAAPRYSPSEIICIIKSWSTRLIFKEYPYIKEELCGGEFWSNGGHIDESSGCEATYEIKKSIPG